MKRASLLILLLAINLSVFSQHDNYAKPWTRWWWLGNIVTEEGITKSLEDFNKAGFGGVEIVPLYGVEGEEANEIDFLSDKWIKMVDHTIKEANRLGMDVDVTLGTGWPFGGPQITPATSAEKFMIDQFSAEGKTGSTFSKKIILEKHQKIEAVLAVDQDENTISVTDKLDKEGTLIWKLPKGKWTIYILKSGLTGQMVKRASPGGKGLVMDHYSKKALNAYLHRFDSVFANHPIKPRSFFNDSYEVYGSTWTPDFLKEFETRRGYKFSDYFHLLTSDKESETKKLLYMDYQQTISELLLENFTQPITKWCNDQDVWFSNQAHGSPGNLIDFYATADFPQTEAFGTSRFDIPLVRNDPDFDESRFGKPEPLTYKFAASGANLTGKKYVGSETFTWLGDHFKVALSQVKPQADELLVNGVNHILYHGIPYSPYEEGFPGWQFYAAVNFGPHGGLWQHIPELNKYIYNCQHILQNTIPDQDVLLYFPVHDVWANTDNKTAINQLDVHKAEKWLIQTPMGDLAQDLMKNGVQFDYISDSFLQKLKVVDGKLVSSGNTYKSLIIPAVEYMPVETLQKLYALKNDGANIIFSEHLPTAAAGLRNNEENNQLLNSIKKEFTGNVITSEVLDKLSEYGITPETLANKDLSFIRKKNKNGDAIYFISNLSDTFKADSIELITSANALVYYNPLTGEEGSVAFSKTESGIKSYLKLLPGESIFITAYKNAELLTASQQKPFTIFRKTESTTELNGNWTISFKNGQSAQPEDIETDKLISWTELGNEDSREFSGTALYQLKFNLPKGLKKDSYYQLNLGDLREAATVTLNGTEIGNVWSVPYSINIPVNLLRKKGNILNVEVTNLTINQIIAIDKEGKRNWKKFKDANIVNINYRPFDASKYEPAPSGILGPIKLIEVIK